jgi:hypothetical protein
MNRPILMFLLALTGCTIFAGYAVAQDESDALRYSMLKPQGTARSMGFGGALGSIGGDFSSLTVNPAGIGVYRSSEMTFTPSLKMNSNNSTYTGAAMTDNTTKFTINNFGLVFTNTASGKRYAKSKWKAVSFGLGVNRIADFSSNHIYSGYNDSSSASEVFLADAIAYPGDIENTNTFAGLGFQSYLTDTFNGQFYKLANHNTGLNQQRSVRQRGGITDMNFSFGGNYEEKLFLGATIGIPVVRYLRDISLREEDASGNPDNDFGYFEYNESLKTTGSGINLKLGFIYNITKSFRAGAAIHTPTYLGLTDVQTKYLTSNTENFKYNIGAYDTNPNTRVESQPNEYQYSLITPWRGVVSASGIIGKYGFITADYEYVNYASARYSFDVADQYYQNEVNAGIKNMFKGASNIRLGGEAKFDIFMVRLGFGYYGNPYQNASMGSERIDISAGAGLRFDNVFIDLGFVHSMAEQSEQPYSINYPASSNIGYIWVPSATIKNSFNNVAITAGIKF